VTGRNYRQPTLCQCVRTRFAGAKIAMAYRLSHPNVKGLFFSTGAS
jgi:hypothetical protein